MKFAGWTLMLLPAWVAVGPTVAAQSVAVRTSVETYGDSLAAFATVHSRDARSTMRLGLALLHRAYSEDGRLFDRARDAFKRAHQLEPDWVYPLLAIGLAEGGKGDWLAAEPLNLGTRVGHGAYRSAVTALISAIQKDPSLTPAIIEMDRIAGSLRDTTVDGQVLEAMRAAVAAGNAHPAAHLMLGRRERAAGHSDSSLTILQRYLATGTDSTLVQFEIARTLLTGDREDGVALYFKAALAPDSETIAELRADLVPIAESDELAEFDTAEGEDRQRFLRRFWEDRARRDLRSPSERLREHYRRLVYARQNFGLSGNRRYYGRRDLYRAPRSETLDDRGVVYVRQGKPEQRIRPVIFGLLPNETWRYQRADGDLLMHFSSGGEGFEGGDISDYRLVPSLFSLRGNGTPKDMLIASRFEISDLYEKIMGWGPHGSARMIREESAWGERSAGIGTGTDAFELEFPERLTGTTDLVRIGQRGDHPLLQVLYALPGIEAGSSVRLRISLFDSSGNVRAWLDTTAASEAMALGLSGGRFELPVAPGQWNLRYALEAGRAGVVMPLDSIVITGRHDALALSGIALGQSRGNIRWVTGPADTALVSPIHDFARDSELHLYYEIYGLAERATFSGSVMVYEKRGTRLGRSRLRLTYREQGQGAITRVRRGIRLSGLEPREYWLQVIAEDENGRQVTGRRAFTVLPVTH